jgi:hypothetical protein
VLTAKGLNETREARCQILGNNSLTANGLQSEIWHLVSDVFLTARHPPIGPNSSSRRLYINKGFPNFVP